jgi:hypothetical protein
MVACLFQEHDTHEAGTSLLGFTKNMPHSADTPELESKRWRPSPQHTGLAGQVDHFVQIGEPARYVRKAVVRVFACCADIASVALRRAERVFIQKVAGAVPLIHVAVELPRDRTFCENQTYVR